MISLSFYLFAFVANTISALSTSDMHDIGGYGLLANYRPQSMGTGSKVFYYFDYHYLNIYYT